MPSPATPGVASPGVVFHRQCGGGHPGRSAGQADWLHAWRGRGARHDDPRLSLVHPGQPGRGVRRGPVGLIRPRDRRRARPDRRQPANQPAGAPRTAHNPPRFQRHSLRIEHPGNIMVRVEQKLRCIAKGRIGRLPLRIGMAMWADDRQPRYGAVRPRRNSAGARFHRKQSIGIQGKRTLHHALV